MRALIACLLLAGVVGLAHGANYEILQVEERDLENGLHDTSLQPGIVDINSTITVKIDKAKLREEIFSYYEQFPSEQLQAIKSIQTSIKEGMDALPAVQEALADYLAGGSPTPEEIKAFFDSTRQVARPVVKILKFAQQEPGLQSLINKRHDLLPDYIPRGERHRATFEAAAQYVIQLERELDQMLTTKGVYVQLGGWLLSNGENSSIHLPRFDTYPLGEFHEVERWKLTALLSEENKQQFEKVAKTAKEINEQGKSISDAFSQMIPDAAGVAFNAIGACARQLEAPVIALHDSTDAVVQETKRLSDSARLSIQSYIQFVAQLKEKYSDSGVLNAVQLPGLFQQLAMDLSLLRKRTASLKTSVKELHTTLNALTASLSTPANVSVTSMDEMLKSCQTIIKQQVVSLQNVIAIMKNGSEISTASLEYTDKVLKHDLDRLPESTRFDLRTIGPRKAGDAVVLRISTGRKEEEVRHIDERYLRLYQVLTYVDVAVSLIFANPEEDFGLTSDFQSAPSYSVLLKEGSRRSVFKNELLKLGYGVNFSALDFNSDQSLELGVGLTVSAFRDYLQFGYGYNLNQDSGYWFLGLRLPISDPGTSAKALP